ncbi:MAG: DUF2247 family protein [Eubacteriales bacterium]
MNKLELYKSFGFDINWTVIKVGWLEHKNLPSQLTGKDVIEYAQSLLENGDFTYEEMELASCYGDEKDDILKLLSRLSEKENIGEQITRKKWTVILLNEVMKTIPTEYVDGLSELTSFWATLYYPDYSPHIIQRKDNNMSAKDYYSKENYELIRNKQYNWMTKTKNLYREKSYWLSILDKHDSYAKAELYIQSDNREFSPNVITKGIGIEPDSQYFYEECKLLKSDGTYHNTILNSWKIETNYKNTEDCQELVKEVLLRIRGKEKLIREICEEYNAQVTVCIVPNINARSALSMNMSKEVIQTLYLLNADYWVDYYLNCHPETCKHEDAVDSNQTSKYID